MIARIGIDLWLPASILMAIFYLTGLHRKLGAPQGRLTSIGLGFLWIAHIIASFIPVLIGNHGEATGAVMLVAGMFLAPVYLAVVAAGVVAALHELVSLTGYRDLTPSRVPLTLLAWAVVPPLLSVIPLLLAPSNPLAQTLREAATFNRMCKDVGVRLLNKPAGPVRSIAYDWDPERLSGRPSAER
jgi:hypothetical protein